MPAAGTTQDHGGRYRRSLILSALVHVLLLLALSSSLILLPHRPIPSRAITAFMVDETNLQQSTAIKERPPQPVVTEPPPQEQQQQQQEQLEQQRQQEAERKEQERQAAETEAERKVQERKAAEAKAKAEAERKEQERKAAEAKAKTEAERKEQERNAAEAKAKAEAERKEQERKAAEARAEAERQARRQAELAAAMAAEEDLLAAQRSGEMDRYIALIQQKVQRNWVPPAGAQTGLECEVAVVQLPNGDVVDAQTVRCNGDAAAQRSVEAAVRRSSPLPLPDNPALFERNLRFIFKPQQ